MKRIFFIFLAFILLAGCRSEKRKLLLKDVQFESIFGTRSINSEETFCLLGRGFFLTPRSENSDSLIDDWIEKHPKAEVIKVSSMGSSTKNKESQIVYCWVIDGSDTLNNYLIKNGCFPGGTMERPETWDELSAEDKELYSIPGEPYDVKVFVEKNEYDKFLEQIKSAENYARENKLGIWEEGFNPRN